MDHIRNFVIIAHIDHGKSTLADRLLERTNTIEVRKMKEQFLDQMDLERERGITIKMAPVRMSYEHEGAHYMMNLIDTPGHSDFGYEVSRALTAVEGAILLVDATQGLQAQTLANYELAKNIVRPGNDSKGLSIIGVVNKIDVAHPDQVDEAVLELAEFIHCSPDDILRVSGKTGEGVDELLRAVITCVPAPSRIVEGDNSSLPRALIFDSLYDDHKGIIAYVRMFQGSLSSGSVAGLVATHSSFSIKEVGSFSPSFVEQPLLSDGEIGYVATGVKDPDTLKIGDTLTLASALSQPDIALPGYREPQPVVFVSFYPEDASQYDELKRALGKLRLTDSSLVFEPDSSEVLGRGFKGGFLGRLHFEITAERLLREFDIETTHSFPSVEYRVKPRKARDGSEEWVTISNPKDFPEEYALVEEPMTCVEILTPMRFLSVVLDLKDSFRFSSIQTTPLGSKICIDAKLPLADIIRDLDDRLKSVSEGFASLSYRVIGMEPADVQKLDVFVAGTLVPGLTRILPKRDIEREARVMVARLKDLLPRVQFSQAIQASMTGRIIARETIPAMRKDVTGYLYGGDRTRKMKLWKKQKKGKARLKERGNEGQVRISAKVFKELLKK
ncbi:MAG: elongation factor 4 [Candidatus Harrisonbacteria bacterium CG10_big_fil_rev_8_21_14_0_10_42_17]|uniref:Elongation factor 4 n=1 Tax=Candidatus Harrisonbacteria bacterium CG10_big_fil_rev_8_21_14_0_10_42_17 TaxID=1974584 RepID=A0A2M6WIZ7_9BACT|nr:MAG: elongation factor 4 [Candidatus Harrisonbacteria bacterium CG10_big_fil_rev_8_21_14_0_10_42_17]